MKVNSVTKPNLGIHQYKYLVSNPIKSADTKQQNNNFDSLNISYPSMYFTGKINPLKIDLFSTKKSFIKVLDNILQENLPNTMLSDEEIHLKMLRRIATIEKKMESYVLDSMILREEGFAGKYNPQQTLEKINKLRKETRRLAKNDNIVIEVGTYHIKDEKTDYSLVEKFKDSILQDHFNLSDVFHSHYESLKEIHSVQELIEKFPSIQIPLKPEEVIADKLENTITRNFYKTLRQTVVDKDIKTFSDLISEKIAKLVNENIKVKNKVETESYITRLSEPIINRISSRLENAISNDSFSSIPEFRKIKKNLISEDDIKMMNIDYDDYVLSVVREQYLNLKNPNEIVYTIGDKKLKISSIKESAYKFDKIPNRIKGLIKTAQDIQAKQRNYDSFASENFHQRLGFYSDRFDDEEILKYIVDFDSCQFHHEDIDMLKKFLNGLDQIWDGKMSVKEFLEYIRWNSIKPIGTEKLNNKERQVAIEKLKQEQKKVAALYNEQKTFDTYINLLYKNKMSYIAELCSSYKPESFEDVGLHKSKIIIDTISSYLNSENNIENTERLGKALFRKTTYFDYLQNSNSDRKLLAAAKKHAENENGTVDIERAGQYIINSNIVSQYPQSIQYIKDKDVVESIIRHFSYDKDKTIEYLCKYDQYADLLPQEKSKILKILDLFDIKKTLDKDIIKNIIENNYILSDTNSIAIMTDTGKKRIHTTITSKAKQEIFDYYKFPKCIELFTAFEDALSQFATNKNSSGIKRLGRNNNSMKDVIELKIMGYPDRLIDYRDSYRFDSFSNTGFH